MPRTRLIVAVPLAAATLLASSIASPAAAQAVSLARGGYQTPPPAIRDAVLAPRHENVEPEDPSPDGRFFVVEAEDRPLTPLALLAKRHYNMGGLQIDPATDRRRYLTTDAPDGYRLVSASDGREIELDVPDGAKVSAAAWSPDGGRLAFLAHLDDGSYLYVADPESGDTRRLTDSRVLATLVTSLEWSGDGRHIFTVLVPRDRGAEPVEPAVATTPRIWTTRDEENELRTYPALLETPYEFALLEHYTTGQLARIDAGSGDVRRIGEPAMIEAVDASPGGEYVRVERIREPFSDIVPVYAFATVEEVWDLDGQALARLVDEPADEGADDEDEDDDGRRGIAWRPDGRGLSFLQREPAPDGEDEDSTSAESEDEDDEDERGDRVMRWLPPFDSGAATIVYESENRIESVRYSDDARTLFITEEDGSEEHLYAVSPDDPAVRHTIYRRDDDEFYADPGDLVVRTGAAGEPVVRTSPDGEYVYLTGTMYHEDPLTNAPRPFLDRVAIRTGEKTRLFESATDRYEEVQAVLDDDASRLLISRESRTEVPNYVVVATGGGDETRLTHNRDHTPDITRAQRHRVEVERADGVTFMVEVTLPEDYRPGTRLPAIFWHYPREYESEEDYDEANRDYNRNAFPGIRARSIEILVRRGWAVVSPDVPIIGPGRDRWNDHYVLHLRNSIAAAIDALDERGWIDRGRLAVGGHSYGGFGTLNALIRTPFFKAGIAGSANSNRTLTPAGFQREPRTLWEGRETYMRMSPIFWMNEMSGALLMYHGIEDQNVGTFPVHSWRSFHALNALGKTAALYMYPYEAHGPRARETLLDLWSRWIAWLDTHVLERGESETAETVADEATTGSRE